jgi:hypothetical protein
MRRYIILILSVAILHIPPLLYPVLSAAFTISGTGAQGSAPSTVSTNKVPNKVSSATASSAKAPSAKAPSATGAPNAAAAQPMQRDVINIVVDRIEGSLIYSKDGRVFEVPGSTKVINNSHPQAKVTIAELTFANDSLVAVSIK